MLIKWKKPGKEARPRCYLIKDPAITALSVARANRLLLLLYRIKQMEGLSSDTLKAQKSKFSYTPSLQAPGASLTQSRTQACAFRYFVIPYPCCLALAMLY